MNRLARSSLIALRKLLLAIENKFDHHYQTADAPMSNDIGHQKWQKYLVEHFNKPGLKVLEVGSREVTGESPMRRLFTEASYVGFDFYPGENVDVVGDAHKLSSYFPGGEFDLIFSSACFEHFAMPWVVAGEIAKVLKVGGTVFVETHFAFSSHERPWHFFHFTDRALRVLFSEPMGFECIESGFSNPIAGRFAASADAYLRNNPVPGMYAHVEFLGRKSRDAAGFDWASAGLDQLLGGTKYPLPDAKKSE